MLIKKEWMRHKRMIVLAVWWLSGAVCAFCQQWSMKTNLLSDAVLLPSLGAEYAVTLRWTVALDASWMPLRLSSEHYLKELKVQPEAHYWFRAPFTGPFVGPALSYRLYNFGGLSVLNTKDSRTQGYLLGMGCTAGWHFSLGPRWGLEPSITLGYAYAAYRRYDTPRSRVVTRRWYVHYFGPTSLNLNLVYMIK